MRRKASLKKLGTPAKRDYHKPVCRHGHTDVMRLHGGWVCVTCLPVQVGSPRRVVLPKGVDDPDTITLRDVFPNRRARRAARAT